MSFSSLGCYQYISVSNWQDALATHPQSCQNQPIPIKPRGTFSTSKSSSQWLNMNDVKGTFYGDVYFTDSIGNNPNRWVSPSAIWPYQISNDNGNTYNVNPNDCSTTTYSYSITDNTYGIIGFEYYVYINSYSGSFNVAVTINENSSTPNTVTDVWDLAVYYPIPNNTLTYSSTGFLSVQRGTTQSKTVNLNISSPNANAQYLLIHLSWEGSKLNTPPTSVTFSFKVGCPGFLNYSFYAENSSGTNSYFVCSIKDVTTNLVDCSSSNIYNTQNYSCNASNVNSTKQINATYYPATGTATTLHFYVYQNGSLIQTSNGFQSTSGYNFISSNFNVADGDNISLYLQP